MIYVLLGLILAVLIVNVVLLLSQKNNDGLSNAKKERADKFIKGFTGEDFNIYCCAKAGKPLKKGFAIMADKMNLNLNEIAMVGDQLYTDILGGNKAGCYTILVNPINVKIEPWFVRFKRFLEKPFM